MERESLRCLKWGILFTFLNIHIGRLNLLPEFIGMLLFYVSIQRHREKRQTEEILKPLLLLLAADGFLHWVWQFENSLERLLIMVIYLYVLYVLFGEVAERIRPNQPYRAGLFYRLRMWMVLIQMVAFVAQPLGYAWLNLLLIFCTVGICGLLIAAVYGIRT